MMVMNNPNLKEKKNKNKQTTQKEKKKNQNQPKTKNKKVLFCSAVFNHSHTWNLIIELHFLPATENLQYRILERPAVDN